MVIYHGRKQKITLNKSKMCFKSRFAFEKGKRVRQSETCKYIALNGIIVGIFCFSASAEANHP